MCKSLCLAILCALAVCSAPANAGLFSAKGPLIAVFGGELFTGEAEGHLDGSGTFEMQSQTKPGLTCRGQFVRTAKMSGAGDLRCTDGAVATFQFQRLSLLRGHGSGSSSRGSMSFTYGLTAGESEPYLALPAGKALATVGTSLAIVDTGKSPEGTVAVTTRSTPLPDPAPGR